MKHLMTSVVGIAAIATIASALALKTSDTVAQAAVPAFSGVCAGMLGLSNAYRVAYEQERGGIDEEGLFGTFVFDFSQSKTSLVVTKGVFSKTPAPYGVNYETDRAANLSFSLSDSQTIPGAKVITINPPADLGSNTIRILATPVNGGNTFLMQGLSGAYAGVCQKV